MSMNFALGLAFGQKLAERAGIDDIGARRRAGIILGAVGMTPVGLLVAKTLIDRQAETERKLKGQKPVLDKPPRGPTTAADDTKSKSN